MCSVSATWSIVNAVKTALTKTPNQICCCVYRLKGVRETCACSYACIHAHASPMMTTTNYMVVREVGMHAKR